jgi:HD-GYP domain-containing protein (c-di-GMP phosphodiesterase class II)
MLILVGLVHDCGKVAIPPQVLNAPRKLTAAEFEVIKMHTVFGYDMLTDFPENIRLGVRGHHEKHGSGGYPDNISENFIPLLAKVTAVSDIYDAMVSKRSYKAHENPFHIVKWIKKLRGSALEASIVDTFIKNMPNEMLGKTTLLSNGETGIIHELDYEDLEHPYISMGGLVFKSNKNLHCVQMSLE